MKKKLNKENFERLRKICEDSDYGKLSVGPVYYKEYKDLHDRKYIKGILDKDKKYILSCAITKEGIEASENMKIGIWESSLMYIKYRTPLYTFIFSLLGCILGIGGFVISLFALFLKK